MATRQAAVQVRVSDNLCGQIGGCSRCEFIRTAPLSHGCPAQGTVNLSDNYECQRK